MHVTSRHHTVATDRTAMAGAMPFRIARKTMQRPPCWRLRHARGEEVLYLIRSEYKMIHSPEDLIVIPGELLTHRYIGQVSLSSKCLGWDVPNYLKIFMLLNE